eukprot:g556.t1
MTAPGIASHITFPSTADAITPVKAPKPPLKKSEKLPTASSDTKIPPSKKGIFVNFDEMMEDMIDCLYEYEEKIERFSGERCKTSSAEQFEDAKRDIMKRVADEAISKDDNQSATDGVISLLQKKLDEAEGEIVQLRKERRTDEGSVDEVAEEMHTLQNDNKELHKLLEEAEKALAETEDMESELSTLRKENKRIRKALKKKLAVEKESQNSVAAAVQDPKLVRELRARAEKAETDFQAIAAESLKVAEEAEKIKTEFVVVRARAEKAELSAETLSEESLKVAEEAEKMSKDLVQLRAENAELRAAEEKQRVDAEDLVKESRAVGEEMSNLRAEIETLRSTNESLRSDKEKQRVDADDLVRESQAVGKEMSKLRTEIATLKSANATLLSERKKQRDDTDDLAKESLAVGEELNKLRAELEDTRASAKTKVEALESKNVELTSLIADRKADSAKRIGVLEATLVQTRRDAATRAEELERSIADVRREAKTAVESAKNAEAETRANAAKQTEVMELANRELRSEVKKSEEEIDALRRQVADGAEKCEAEIAEVHKESARLAKKHELSLGAMRKKHAAKLSDNASLLREAEVEMGRLETAKKELEEKVRSVGHESAKRLSNLTRSLRDVRRKCAAVRTDTKALRTTAVAQLKQLPKMLSPTDPLWAELKRLAKRQSERVHAAELMYAKEFKERRRLHDMVQELRGNIRVFCRVRPQLEKESDTGVVCSFPMEGVVAVENPRKRRQKQWEFDRVFDTKSTTEDLFREVGPLVTSVMDGFNVCVFAYGQTGSGKTYTMEGTKDDRGIYWRSLSKLFEMKRARESTGWKVDIRVSLLEVYNESIRDLLAAGEVNGETPGVKTRSAASAKRGKGLSIKLRRETGENYVEGLSKPSVKTLEEIRRYMKIGKKVRSVGATDMNEHSSRSHCMLSVYVESTAPRDGKGFFRGKLHLVDLAGSERLSKSKATGQRQKETKLINKSLSALGDVIAAQANHHGHVPYRNSTLTYLLQDSLGGNSKTLMIAQVSPTAYNADESYCTLEFSSRTRCVELGRATKNESTAPVLVRARSTSPRARDRGTGK